MADKKKIFVMLSRVPFPLEKGDKLRAYHQIKALSETYRISLCCLSDKKVDDSAIRELEKITGELHILYLKKWLIYWNVFKMLFSNKPFQVGYFFQKGIKKQVLTLIEKFNPDSIYCQLIRVSEYVKNIHNIPKTIDYMDAFSKGMYRRSEVSKGLKKYIFKLEGDRLRLYENKIFDYFDHHTIISGQDRQYIGHSNNNAIDIVENGIDDSFFTYKSDVKPEFDIVFVGNLNYAPNIACCEFIIDELYPELIKRMSDTKILLAGANPHDKILGKAERYKNVKVSGWIEDIRSGYCSGKVFVAPLFIGTGLQNKLLEAMALGVPCVTTDLANNALGAEADKSILLANSTQAFVESIYKLLSDKNLYDSIADEGKTFVRNHFNWKDSSDRIPL